MKMNAKFRAHISAVGLLAGFGVLYTFPPTEHSFYPRCLFYALTGLQCPGCGGTRALYHLLHFDFSGAIRYNALVTVLIPMVLTWFIFWYTSVIFRGHAPDLRISRPIAVCLYLIVLFFAVARNGAFSFLS
ncbi:MAG: DUF2752 domain-containing protein [Acidobacteriia bacterium]|nr:DUF2752 domain-containing protein [Terriglobia bacterium]